jgi:hypothetical protein
MSDNKIIIKKEAFKELFDMACSTWKPRLEEALKPYIFLETVEFTKQFVEEIKKACTKEQLEVFNKIFKDYPKDNNKFDVTTYKEVCKRINEPMIEVASHYGALDDTSVNQKKLVAWLKIQQLKKFFNGDWKENFNDINQQKWFPYFSKVDGDSRGFEGSACRNRSYPSVAAYYKDEATSNHIGKTEEFADIYKDYNDN